MDHRIHQLANHPLAIHKNKQNVPNKAPEKSFHSYLNEAQTTLKISKHAQKRLDERNIQINEQQWDKIEHKVREAKTKGVTDSLVITNEAALVVSAKNHTVITAMNKEEAADQLFTNINGTILMKD